MLVLWYCYFPEEVLVFSLEAIDYASIQFGHPVVSSPKPDRSVNCKTTANIHFSLLATYRRSWCDGAVTNNPRLLCLS